MRPATDDPAGADVKKAKAATSTLAEDKKVSPRFDRN